MGRGTEARGRRGGGETPPPHAPLRGDAWEPLAAPSGSRKGRRPPDKGQGCPVPGLPSGHGGAEPPAAAAKTLPGAAAGLSPLPASRTSRRDEWVPQCPPGPGSAPEPWRPHRHRLPPAPRSPGVERSAGGGGAASPACNAQVGGRPPPGPGPPGGVTERPEGNPPRARSPGPARPCRHAPGLGPQAQPCRPRKGSGDAASLLPVVSPQGLLLEET